MAAVLSSPCNSTRSRTSRPGEIVHSAGDIFVSAPGEEARPAKPARIENANREGGNVSSAEKEMQRNAV